MIYRFTELFSRKTVCIIFKSSGLKLCYMVINALLFPNQTYQIRDIVKFQMLFAVSNKKIIKSDT
jgi:hypothetical protein